jgi:hypothetical protein
MVLAQRIIRLAREAHILVAGHDVGSAQRFRRIVARHEAGVVGRDPDRQRTLVTADGGALILRKREDAGQLIERANARPELPMPVVPFGGGGTGTESLIEST